jgi:hypothetical protein
MTPMHSVELSIDTGGRPFHDLTPAARRFCRDVDAGDGLLSVFAPHATAGIALFELRAGPSPLTRSAAPHSVRASSALRAPASGAPASSRQASGAASLRSEPTAQQSIVLVDPNGDNPRRTVRLSFLAG